MGENRDGTAISCGCVQSLITLGTKGEPVYISLNFYHCALKSQFQCNIICLNIRFFNFYFSRPCGMHDPVSWYNLPSPSPPTSSHLQPHLPPLCLFHLHSTPTLMHTCTTCTTMSCPLL